MAFNITQCPGCESTFNTNAHLLESAAGRVRCGACLTVFQAVQNYLVDSDDISPESTEESVFIGSDPGDYFDPSTFLTRSALTEDKAEYPVSEDIETFDHSEFLENLEEVLDTAATPQQVAPDETTATTATTDGAGESTQDLETEGTIDTSPIEEEDSTETIRARALSAEFKDEEALEAIPEESLAVLSEFSTPLELLQKRETRWASFILFSIISLCLGALLAGQYMWRHMAVYNQVSQIRPLYEFACDRLGCDLPVYSRTDEIRSDSLAVRSHPELSNGLLLNISIRNTAAFPQPFPVLILSFNTTANDVVALREFAPSEYLPPGLRSVFLMPVMTPVQIELEIIDPGADAVNYTLAFRTP